MKWKCNSRLSWEINGKKKIEVWYVQPRDAPTGGSQGSPRSACKHASAEYAMVLGWKTRRNERTQERYPKIIGPTSQKIPLQLRTRLRLSIMALAESVIYDVYISPLNKPTREKNE